VTNQICKDNSDIGFTGITQEEQVRTKEKCNYSAGIINTSPPAPLHKWSGAGGEVFMIPAE